MAIDHETPSSEDDGAPCRWAVSMDNGITIIWKDWEDGDPEGSYTDDDGGPVVVIVTACEDECLECA